MESAACNPRTLSACDILVVGDVMLDRYWFGAADRISPEAPVPVLAVERRERRLGGAGNVARNIVALGGRCALLAVVGDDDAGAELSQLAAAENIACQFVAQSAAPTTVKLRLMARNQQLLRADFESSPPPAALDEVAAKFSAMVENYQAVVLSDYGKGCLGKVENLIQAARAKNIPVLVDPKGGDFSRYRGADLVTPNLKEFEQVAGAVADAEDMRAKARRLRKTHGLRKLLVTMSDRGMTLFSDAREPLHQAARVSEIHDVVGAGDTVIAVLAMAMARGLEDRVGLTLASHAAGIVVSKLGTATATVAELKTSLRAHSIS